MAITQLQMVDKTTYKLMSGATYPQRSSMKALMNKAQKLLGDTSRATNLPWKSELNMAKE